MEQNKKNESIDRTGYKCQVTYHDGTISCVFECPNKKSLRHRMKQLEDYVFRNFSQHGWKHCDVIRTEYVCSSDIFARSNEIRVFNVEIRGYRVLFNGDVLYSDLALISAWL